MNIQPISELDSFTFGQSQLSGLSSINAYFEVSLETGNNMYQSYKLPISSFVYSIISGLNYLEGRANSLTSDTASIRNSYVKKIGDTMTGCLHISVDNNNTANKNMALHIKNGSLSVDMNSSAPNSTPINIHNAVKINQGSLTCDNEIHGCALTAKWC